MPAAEKVLAFLGTLPIVSGLRAGETMEVLDFQERFVPGVYAENEGERLVRLAGLSVARGNGKSGLLAGLSLAHLLGPMIEPYGECYAAALDREHLRDRTDDGRIGRSRLSRAAETVQGVDLANRHARQFLARGASPSGVIEHPGI